MKCLCLSRLISVKVRQCFEACVGATRLWLVHRAGCRENNMFPYTSRMLLKLCVFCQLIYSFLHPKTSQSYLINFNFNFVLLHLDVGHLKERSVCVLTCTTCSHQTNLWHHNWSGASRDSICSSDNLKPPKSQILRIMRTSRAVKKETSRDSELLFTYLYLHYIYF